ncbi:Gfo/Idh/MocA family protein [Occultella aeris]|uniref:Inositol 2-dehydrogenase n=1 Tax=Occultella aeris TaxID=2761496 RepID=A0A7M4DN35_9MICO|nr:Gfo/Idh/MocA family oxidoreductase [Occultella aeris]VZO38845.1 Inositol 2-dehydrogenase [Occultella aeris]
MTTTFAVVGIHGFGGHHLRELVELTADGLAEVIAVADPRGAEGAENVPPTARAYPDLTALLAAESPNVVIIATPIHTHLPLAVESLRAGSHVLLEKPTTASLAELDELIAVSAETGRSVQVGFQSFGSHALPAIDALIAGGEIGELVGVGGVGTWLRDTRYYARSRWAGRRTLDGVAVVDGAVTNPLAHAVATALRIAGATTTTDVAEVVVDLYHAHDIEADDTSAVRLRTTSGIPVALGLSLTSATQSAPRLIVRGTRGTAELRYTDDVLTVRTPDGERTETFERTSLQRNLVDHITTGAPLVADARDTGAFIRVLEAVRTAPDPAPIAAEFVQWRDDEHGRHPEVADVEAWCERVASEYATFAELGAPWAASSPPTGSGQPST